jgi:hypothetical protein
VDEGERAVVEGGSDSDLAGAQGKLVMFLASLLARAGVVETAEFAALLSTFAATVEETDPGEGRLLAAWASCVASTTTN